MSRDNNLEVYEREDVLKWYLSLSDLVPVEKEIYKKYSEKLINGRILDIGIGGGRTTGNLISLCYKYTGIDYSENFVKYLKKKFPTTDLQCMDASNMVAFADQSFDFVNFSFNGLDYCDEDKRNKILAEIRRVLRKDGVFFFSTHNMKHSGFNKWPWANKDFTLSQKIKTLIKLIPFLPRHFKKKKGEIYTENYAIINDSAHNYSLMTYYISPKYLIQQMNQMGFTSIELLNKKGDSVNQDSAGDWMFCVAK